MSTSVKLLSFGACCVLALGACRPRPSSVPLGGERDSPVAASPRPSPSALPAGAAALPSPAPGEDAAGEAQAQAQAQEVEVSASTPPSALAEGGKPAAPSAFQVKPYVARQSWTRVVDIDLALKVGPAAVDMKMTTHQEARFEVLSVGPSSIEKLSIDYAVYTTKLSIMGSTQDSPEELAGKRFVITFNQGKPEVRDAAGGIPPKKQVDSVKDDAREPLETEKALKELTGLTAKGRGDFSALGAIALAGGEDEDTKVTGARGTLQRLLTAPSGEKTASIDLSYTLNSQLDEHSSLEAKVAGTLSVVDAPARYQASTMQGPMELRSSEPDGMAGRGVIKVVTSYRY
ncbi:MAG: hypothetical protein EOO73_36020 [Myxococcales bacterium]|nr:MAG: hypothetical protein EOO73_36020 [Myxococcales bacterium]